MRIKYAMKGDEMQSLFTMAWSRSPVTSAGAEDPVFSGFHAVEPSVEAEEDATPEETEVLAAAMAVQAVSEPTTEEVEWLRNRKRLEAERVMHLFNLGFTEL